MFLKTKFSKIKFTYLALATFVSLPMSVFAENDSTRIGISVEIKTKQACDYAYAFENGNSLSNSSNSSFSSCNINSSRLQEHANQVASLEIDTTASSIDGKKLRVLMTVQ